MTVRSLEGTATATLGRLFDRGSGYQQCGRPLRSPTKVTAHLDPIAHEDIGLIHAPPGTSLAASRSERSVVVSRGTLPTSSSQHDEAGCGSPTGLIATNSPFESSGFCVRAEPSTQTEHDRGWSGNIPFSSASNSKFAVPAITSSNQWIPLDGYFVTFGET